MNDEKVNERFGEPLRLGKFDRRTIYTADDQTFADLKGEKNVQRIVDCVNACQSIPSSDLQSLKLSDVLAENRRLREGIQKVASELAELLKPQTTRTEK